MPDARGADCTLTGQMRPVRAVAFDFNGTLSDDEPILLSVYQEMFAEHGRPLTEVEYFDTLAGRSEEAIIASWLGVHGATLDALVEERIDRYLARCRAGETVSAAVRDAVAYAAARVPVAVVSGAFRREIEPVLAGAQLDGHISVLVAADDVERGKPNPAGYALALELLGGIAASEAVAFEDTEAGVASAKAAGLRCIAVTGTHPPDRLRLADELVAALDVDVLSAVLR
jgi:beta-phosphoglucomutase-like phosphatase (HAD superfamily)